MTQTKLIVKTALMLFVLAVFSGCGTQYITIPCEVDKPQRITNPQSCDALYPNDNFLYGKCISEKLISQEADYDMLKKAFDACKK